MWNRRGARPQEATADVGNGGEDAGRCPRGAREEQGLLSVGGMPGAAALTMAARAERPPTD